MKYIYTCFCKCCSVNSIELHGVIGVILECAFSWLWERLVLLREREIEMNTRANLQSQSHMYMLIRDEKEGRKKQASTRI